MLSLTSFYSTKRLRRMWVLTKAKTFRVDSYTIEVPRGYWFDGASVPRPLWFIFEPTGKAFEAACLHDWLYDTKGLSGIYSRKLIDDIFLAHMKIDNVSRIQRLLFYFFVRYLGWIYWNNNSVPEVYRSQDKATIF